MMYAVKKCGVKFKPLSLVISYIDKSNNKLRCRQIPLRDFKRNSKVSVFSEELKKTQRHRALLKDISQLQIEKMLLIIQGHMKGKTIEEAVELAEMELTVDPNEDLCKADLDQVEKAKRIMDKSFHEKQITPEDPNFNYDVEIEFDKPVASSGWDSDDEF